MKTKSELRAILFKHLDGIVTVPNAYSLYKKGVLDFLLENERATLQELVEKFKIVYFATVSLFIFFEIFQLVSNQNLIVTRCISN